ncbi:MAG TPA: dihydroorotate dehydrogenase-like protein [Bryobacteraceae bacterium]|nr:dihydroorotate dehydrogenase-like protein [Bryobacteraceae bacterium]
MIDLTTSYLGLTLANPLVASASPLCQEVDNIRRMEDAGAGAVVLHSLFEEQIETESRLLDQALSNEAEGYAESPTFFPDLPAYDLGPEAYVEHVRRARAAVRIPVIASLNGITLGGWTRYAKYIEEAGADALELNVYYLPTDPALSGADVEQRYVDLVSTIRNTVRIPIAVKLGPWFSAPAHIARRLDQAGANGLVLFNRFYQPDFDLRLLDVIPNLILSNSNELLLRLHWAAILYGRIRASIAITGGVHTAEDVLKSMMAGASVAMMTSALLKRGIDYLAHVHADLLTWMEEHEYVSIRQMQGSMSQRSVSNPGAYERTNYMRVLSSYSPRLTI